MKHSEVILFQEYFECQRLMIKFSDSSVFEGSCRENSVVTQQVPKIIFVLQVLLFYPCWGSLPCCVGAAGQPRGLSAFNPPAAIARTPGWWGAGLNLCSALGPEPLTHPSCSSSSPQLLWQLSCCSAWSCSCTGLCTRGLA